MKKIFIIFCCVFGLFSFVNADETAPFLLTVLDKNGKPLSDATVKNKNYTDRGCVTDNDGTISGCNDTNNYILAAGSDGKVLVTVSYTGYKTQTVELERGVRKEIRLEEGVQEIEEATVLGDDCNTHAQNYPDWLKQNYPHALRLSGRRLQNCKIEECEDGYKVYALANKCEKEDTIDITISLGSIPIKDDDKTVKKDNKDDFLNAINKIDGWISEQKSGRSKWKDAAGNFNGARLASDLTAGVVLGTVGGVVSGVVIKKKQVEKGFDSLGCYVGGQKMADWKDEFKVVFQRY